MATKIVTIKVQSGKLPTSDYKNKDKCLTTIYSDLYTSENRVVETDKDNLIQFSSISNMVHVLMGERPVPSRKNTLRSRSEVIDGIVKEGYVKILNTPYVDYKTKKGEDGRAYYKEMTTGKKPQFNSNAKAKMFDSENNIVDGFVTWSSLNLKSVYSPKIIPFIERIKAIGVDLGYAVPEKDIRLLDLLKEVREIKKYKDELVILTDSKHCQLTSPIGNYLMNNGQAGNSLNNCKSPNLAALSNNQYPVYKLSIDAEIVLFLSDKDAELISNGTRCATFMDGGLATVESIESIDSDIVDEVIDDYLLKDYKSIKTL